MNDHLNEEKIIFVPPEAVTLIFGKPWKSFAEHGLPPLGRYLIKDSDGKEFIGIVKSYNSTIYWIPEDTNIRCERMRFWKELD